MNPKRSAEKMSYRASARNPARRLRSICATASAIVGVAVVVVVPAAARADLFQATPHLQEGEHFTIDPVVDGVIITGGAGFALLLGLVLKTGEIKPTVPASSSVLLPIDRVAVTQTIDPHASVNSNFGLWAAYGYAVLDPILSGVRNGPKALLGDAIMYAESIAVTQVFTNMTKIAVRRPRPIDYRMCEANQTMGTCSPGSDTNLQLSFFSGHASGTATVAATATYLAFVRHTHTARPWITLAVGTALTAFVSYERVRAGEHFPTDVIMGSMAGAAIGVLVPHFHRHPHLHQDELEAPPLLICFAPTSRGGGSVSLGWVF